MVVCYSSKRELIQILYQYVLLSPGYNCEEKGDLGGTVITKNPSEETESSICSSFSFAEL